MASFTLYTSTGSETQLCHCLAAVCASLRSNVYLLLACRYELAGGRINMVNYAVPTSPGTARILHKVQGDRRMLSKKIQRIAGFKPDLLICKDHMENNAVLDGDGIFLHFQVTQAMRPLFSCTERTSMATYGKRQVQVVPWAPAAAMMASRAAVLPTVITASIVPQCLW